MRLRILAAGLSFLLTVFTISAAQIPGDVMGVHNLGTGQQIACYRCAS